MAITISKSDMLHSIYSNLLKTEQGKIEIYCLNNSFVNLIYTYEQKWWKKKNSFPYLSLELPVNQPTANSSELEWEESAMLVGWATPNHGIYFSTTFYRSKF